MSMNPHFTTRDHKPAKKRPRYQAPEGANAVVAKFVKVAYFIKRDENGRHLSRLKKTYLYPKPYVFSVTEKTAKKLHPGASLFTKDVSGKLAEVVVTDVIRVDDVSNHTLAEWMPKQKRAKLGVVKITNKTEQVAAKVRRSKVNAQKKHQHSQYDNKYGNHSSHHSYGNRNNHRPVSKSKYYTDNSLIRTHYNKPKHGSAPYQKSKKKKKSNKPKVIQYNKHGIPINL